MNSNLQNSPSRRASGIAYSFFDDAKFDGRSDFWLKSATEPLKKPSDVIIMEGELYKKSKSSDFLKNRYFVMFEDRLVLYNNSKEKKEKGFVHLDRLLVEQIAPSEEKHGFLLTSNRKYDEIFCSNTPAFEKWQKAFRNRAVFRDFNTNYTIMKAIGKGSFALVYQAYRNTDRKEFAIKSFDKRKLELNPRNKAALLLEIKIMRSLDHPNIIKLYEVYETDNHINLVLELLKGGELFDKILQKGHFSENDAVNLMSKLLNALHYIHEKGIMHRDLKPENLILANAGDDTDIKLADFGLAAYINQEEQLFKRCGTPGYVAPEVLADEAYNEKCDVFSAGLICYILVTGCSPFYGASYNEILRKNKKGLVSFKFDDLEHKPSAHATELLKQMLERDFNTRVSVKDALEHEWFGSSAKITLPVMRDFLAKFQAENKITKDAAKGRDAENENELIIRTPVMTGRTDTIEEDKGKTFMDSPSMRPGADKERDIRKMAILKNAQARALFAGAPMLDVSLVPKEDKRGSRSNPESPLVLPGENKDRKSAFGRNQLDIPSLKNKLLNLE